MVLTCWGAAQYVPKERAPPPMPSSVAALRLDTRSSGMAYQSSMQQLVRIQWLSQTLPTFIGGTGIPEIYLPVNVFTIPGPATGSTLQGVTYTTTFLCHRWDNSSWYLSRGCCQFHDIAFCLKKGVFYWTLDNDFGWKRFFLNPEST